MVSIIIPTYNSQEFLDDCLNSVISQTFAEYEVIIVDDCSNDGTINIIEKFKKRDQRIKSIYLGVNSGAGVARNIGLQNSNQRFVTFLDSDDMWFPEKLKTQVQFMLHNDCAFSYTDYYLLNKNGIPNKRVYCPKIIKRNKLLLNNYIKTLTVMYDSTKFDKVQMPELRKRQDWGFWFELIKSCKAAHGISTPLAYYRTSNKSLSSNKLKLLKENFAFYNKHLNFSKIDSFYRMLIFLKHYFLFRTLKIKKIRND